MHAVQSFRQHMQVAVAAAERLELLDRCEHILAVLPRDAVALANVVQLLGELEPTGILRMGIAFPGLTSTLSPEMTVSPGLSR